MPNNGQNKRGKRSNQPRKQPQRQRNEIAPQRRSVGRAPVAATQTVRNQAKGFVARQSTTDYLGNIQFSTLADGAVIFSKRIEPGLFPTLSRFASSFQRIRYHNIKFSLSAHLPTNTSGGYLMGFRPDSTDRMPSDVMSRKQFVTGTPGSIQNSIWQSYQMNIPQRELTNRLFYTSEGSDPREFSPGVLYVVVDGAVNQAGSLSLSATYDVSCSVPSVEFGNEGQSPPTLEMQATGFAYDGDSAMRDGDSSSSSFLIASTVFPGLDLSHNYVYSTYTFGVKTSAEASQDIQYTRYVGIGTNPSDGTPYLHSMVPKLGGGYEIAPFKSPTGNTQVFGAATVLDFVTRYNHGSWDQGSGN